MSLGQFTHKLPPEGLSPWLRRAWKVNEGTFELMEKVRGRASLELQNALVEYHKHQV
jgi:hypothetical protein